MLDSDTKKLIFNVSFNRPIAAVLPSGKNSLQLKQDSPQTL